ncbi:MAG: formate/nitrite transporter family protein [Oscillospiraceae bacterium]|nr:formate/nitrite transporter family protein [Oscillospiraceae bacterium]
MNNPNEIAIGFADLGVQKATMPKYRAFLLAVMAGVFISMSGVAATIATSVSGKLAGALIFPAGLIMVVTAGSELFTGDSLMFVSRLERKINAKQMISTIILVYAGNFIGSALIALLATYSGALAPYAEAVVATAAAKASLPLHEAILRGVLCNILVCLAVWIAAASDNVTGKVFGLYFPIVMFVLCGFEHCVANMYYLPAGAIASIRYDIPAPELTLFNAVFRNMIPVTFGNMLGGMSIGLIYWAAYLKRKKKKA